MTQEEFLSLAPCREGREYAAKFATIREAWDNCKSVRDMLWLAGRFPECKNGILIFAWECASIAQSHSENTADAAYAAAAADADADAAAAYAADAAAYAAYAAYAAAYAAYAAYAAADAAYAAEKDWQVMRIKQLFTSIIFPE